MATYQELRTRSQQVRDEQNIGGNTALRVGQLLMDIVKYFYDTDMAASEYLEQHFAMVNDGTHLLNWQQSPIVILHTMGDDYDDGDFSALSQGENYYRAGFIMEVNGQGGGINGETPKANVLYVNIANDTLYTWNGASFDAITSGGGGGISGDDIIKNAYYSNGNLVLIIETESGDKTVTIPVTFDASNYVPTSRTVNGKALNNNITLSQSDIPGLVAALAAKVGYSDDEWLQVKAGAIQATTAVQDTTTVNGKRLNNNIVIGMDDIPGLAQAIGEAGEVKSVTINGTNHTPNSSGVVDLGTIQGEKGDKGDTGNVTVTDGVAQITIVNDLTTGGTGDALSAEMGKVLNNKLSIEGNDIIPTASTLNYYFINASAKWQSYADVTSKLVPITPNKSYNIYAQSSGTSHISVLSQDNHTAQNPAFATGFTARISVSNGNVYHLDAPSDANYILITSGTFAGSVYPSKIVEVGSKFDGIDSQIEGLDERLGAVEKMDINGKVDRSFQQITLKRSTNIFVSAGNIGSDGKPTDTSSPHSKYTPFIPILGGSQLTYYLDRRDAAKYVAFYSSASTDGFISATAVTSLTVKTIDVPETAKFFRTSSRVDDTTYDPYVTFVNETTGEDVGEIKDVLGISSSETVLYGKDITDNGTIGSLNADGTVASGNTSWRVTDFIHAKCGTTIRWASGYSRLCFYSSASESSFLFAISSSSTEKQFLVPFGTDYYFRVALGAGNTTTYVGYYKDDSSVVNAINEKLQPLSINAKWLSLGTSITWYNNNIGSAAFTKGYQTRVLEVLKFNEFVNKGVNGGSMVGLASALSNVVSADYVTIEHGVNDWMQGQSVGTIDDFISDTGAGTFCGAYRKVIDKVYELNPSAQIIICTPRKAYGFKDNLPSHWYDIKGGKYLKDYADAAIEIARFMSLPICDWFNESGMNQNNLAANSIDVALHPNDEGYQKMANLLVQTFKKILPYE